MSSPLVPHYRFFTHRTPVESRALLLVTTSHWDRTLAYRAIRKRVAFDLIIKPLVPQEVAQTVRLALWQKRLLTLLESRERMLSTFQEHMVGYPPDLSTEAQLASRFASIESTLHAVQTNMRPMVSVEEETAFFDMAVAVEQFTRKRAHDRLTSLYEDGLAY